MDAGGGVVTVSWGGFRCRIEGFEDPMAALADALPWLSQARPDQGLGPASSRCAPRGVRREHRNGALVLRPAAPDERPAEADDAVRDALANAARDGAPATGGEGGFAPASLDRLIRMGLSPDFRVEDAEPEAASEPPGPFDAEGPDSDPPRAVPSAAAPDPRPPSAPAPDASVRDAVARLVRSQPTPAAPPAPPVKAAAIAARAPIRPRPVAREHRPRP